MPQSNNQVGRFDLSSDLNNYYNNSIATIMHNKKRCACKIEGFFTEGGEVQAWVRLLPEDKKNWEEQIHVPYEALDFVLPPLGLVQSGTHWFHLMRQPARRMRKGYNEECINWQPVGHNSGMDQSVSSIAIVRQVWYGNDKRITNNVVVVGKEVYYTTEHVATVNDEGLLAFIPEREKLGELVCKILQNNWDAVISKTTVRTLPL